MAAVVEQRVPILIRLFLFVLLSSGLGTVCVADDLAGGFASPPSAAKAQTWWDWMNGNITREGITADLEAMKTAGLSGATIVNLDCGIPRGPIGYGGKQWYGMVRYAVEEAHRLDLHLGIENCAGWSSSGGPWTTPGHAMQEVVSSERQVSGPGDETLSLPQPMTRLGFYRDIAVVAFPTPLSETAAAVTPKVTASAPGLDATALLQAGNQSPVILPAPTASKPQYIEFEFAQPYEARMISLSLQPLDKASGGGLEGFGGEFQCSQDGRAFHRLRPFFIGPEDGLKLFNVHIAPVRFFRILFTKTEQVNEEERFNLCLLEAHLKPVAGLEYLRAKEGLIRFDGTFSVPKTRIDAGMTVVSDKLIDLTSHLQPGGRFDWQAPPGNWTIVRLGYTPIGTENGPAAWGGTGLECDKLSREAVQAHWDGMMGKLAAMLGPETGRTFNGVLIDSYEVQGQDWTPAFRAEFKKRRGYDLLPYLPIFAGRVVDTPEKSERFLWDMRRTIADLFAENYYDYFGIMARRSGLVFMAEPYGNGPTEDLLDGGGADLAMGEYWLGGRMVETLKLAASVAHTRGRTLAGAESLTSDPPLGRWLETPFSLKRWTDDEFAHGINQLIFHRYAHQPWLDRWPGMTMGLNGTHLERTNTWWKQSTAWFQYLARCQYLLRQGRFVADVIFFDGESAPSTCPSPDEKQLPRGYDFDGCDTDVLMNQLSVRDRLLVLPDGMSYRALVLPPGQTMTPATLARIKALADAGAIILGPKPLQSPSLSGYPECDARVKTLADELWNSGKISADKSLREVFATLKLKPDFECDSAAGLLYNHRRTGNADIYFISNPKDAALDTDAVFRVSGRAPEFWHADTGQIENTPVYTEAEGRIRMPLHLEPHGSIFVLFRGKPKSDHAVAVSGPTGAAMGVDFQLRANPAGSLQLETSKSGAYAIATATGKIVKTEVLNIPPAQEVAGSWQVSFPPNWGAPDQVTLDHLISWTDYPDPGVKYFSGTATYRKSLNVPNTMLGPGKRLYLDLGVVHEIAVVKLNGVDLGILWKPPFSVEITNVAKPGANGLEIDVVNLWPNRLIGDEKLPEDRQWITAKLGDSLKEWPQWVLDDKPSPTGRFTFTTWRHWNKDDPLLPSGLLGPVMLRSSIEAAIPLRQH